MSKTEKLLERRNKAVALGVGNLGPIFADHASNSTITDVDGEEYIDFVGGIGVNNVGHCNEKVVAAITAQAEKLVHSCFHIAMYEPYVALAEKLIEMTPGNFEKKAVLLNSGAEAVENAVKIARLASGKSGIVVYEGGFHGRTLLTMSMTSKVKPYKLGFGPYAPEIYRIPYPYCYRCPYGKEYPSCDVYCAEQFKKWFIGNAAPENIAALVAEPIAGEGGFLVPPPEYFPRIKEICADNGIYFVADEIQSGGGRTGKMCAMEHWGVEADLVTMAKSIGGGMPISAVVGKKEIMDAVHPGGLGGTYGGNPVSCAAALASIESLEDGGILEKGQVLGDKLKKTFLAWQDKYSIIGEVRGLGAMIALEIVADRESKTPDAVVTKKIVADVVKKKLLLLSCGNFGNVLRVLVPLSVDEETLNKGLSILEEAIAEYS
ncbi:4-aminobutyrate--2-oxoglutarate transaminase [Desulfovibrio gilichinskyi]|uniref:4-aminobutyrate aminotransferase apoenzyme n=1 Tax=Desulfovibrio gilichinskyi TaxID=1519643 RepID=A0A1X7E6V5_9BACT|nr:4-aminobutyrate--2-oxoglutarate transaminase [Desulfovibrio gilichinskyi]SMF28636.1 4-aminobutyrate aminotransferase apoenzyme [Desulfovibrio gilichinskyi]